MGELADAAGGAGVDGVDGAAGGGDLVALVQDEQGALGLVPQGVEQQLQVRRSLGVLGALTAQEGVGDDEVGVGGPGVHAPAALSTAGGHKVAVVQGEGQTKALLQLLLPLDGDGGGRDDKDPLDALAEQELLEDEPGLDGLAQAHVVGDEEVDSGEFQSFAQGLELVGL